LKKITKRKRLNPLFTQFSSPPIFKIHKSWFQISVVSVILLSLKSDIQWRAKFE
jgi:hypothetical protein